MKVSLLPLALLAPMASLASENIYIDTESTSMVFHIWDDMDTKLLYYGTKVNDKKAFRQMPTRGSQPLYSTRGARETNEPALAITYGNGKLNTILKYVSHETKKLPNIGTETTINLADEVSKVGVQLIYTAYEKEDVITCKSIITNTGDKPLTLENFYSSQLSVAAGEYNLYSFSGTWGAEMRMRHTVLSQGSKSIESRKLVRATQSDNPSFVLCLDQEMQEESGEVIIGALAWNGNYKINFEVTTQQGLHILSGINPYSSRTELAPTESLSTPAMIYTYSPSGVGQASRNMHDWARGHGIWNGGKIRESLLNSWEGAYFRFDTQTIIQMIDDAADMGLEMFVLDDGWFGNKYPRNDAHAGLGDWQVNMKKLPEGIGHLADHAISRGIRFGIWIEPEMVNPKSELAENHPDWIIGERGREFPLQRDQLLLDLSNPEVQDFVFGVFDEVMSMSPNISFIKWDANRNLENMGSTYLPEDKQQELGIKYALGLQSVYQRIRDKYPDVVIQSCGSGGGRVDYGTLKYHDETWTSDNTEAHTRAYIQHDMNLIYPATITASHVSASPNHQTGSVIPLKFRFDMAMSGRLGMEIQPRKMTEQERAEAREYIKNYKSIRDIVQQGDLYRLASPYKGGFYSLMYVSKDKKRAVVFHYCLEHRFTSRTPILKLTGLDSSKSYTVTELNTNKPSFWAHGKTLTGDYLKHVGVDPRLNRVYTSSVLLLESK